MSEKEGNEKGEGEKGIERNDLEKKISLKGKKKKRGVNKGREKERGFGERRVQKGRQKRKEE